MVHVELLSHNGVVGQKSAVSLLMYFMQVLLTLQNGALGGGALGCTTGQTKVVSRAKLHGHSSKHLTVLWLVCVHVQVMGMDEPFGFEDGPQYSLTTFHTLADSYKQRWFSGLTSPDPDKESIERDFWDIVEEGSLRHDVQVVYGADLPTLKHGSGFATDPQDPYSAQPWNLNVMPTLAGSLLRHLSRASSCSNTGWCAKCWRVFDTPETSAAAAAAAAQARYPGW